MIKIILFIIVILSLCISLFIFTRLNKICRKKYGFSIKIKDIKHYKPPMQVVHEDDKYIRVQYNHYKNFKGGK